jgi:DNA-binding NtrC family response regulator
VEAGLQNELHSWPGNIRELENVLGDACTMAIRDTIDVEDLPTSVRNGRTSAATNAPESEPNHTGVLRRTRKKKD